METKYPVLKIYRMRNAIVKDLKNIFSSEIERAMIGQVEQAYTETMNDGATREAFESRLLHTFRESYAPSICEYMEKVISSTKTTPRNSKTLELAVSSDSD